MTKQIEYSYWGENKGTEHEGYFEKINLISHLLANELEGFRVYITNEPQTKKDNTICVLQAKEKFGKVRAYTRLADEKIVIWKYKKRHKIPDEVLVDTNKKDFKEFYNECYFKDCSHYRSVYFKFKKLFPQYWKAISSAADFPELLCETKEEFETKFGNSDWLNQNQDYKNKIYKICRWVQTKGEDNQLK